MPPVAGKAHLFFLIGFGLVNAVVFTFIGMSLTFIAGFTLSAWHFPLGVLCSLALNYYAAHYFLGSAGRRAWVKTAVILLAIILLSILFSLLFYDTSFDGQLYHLDSAIHLKNGWTPFRHELPPGINQAIWLNHYGKGVEGPQGAIYALTNHLETTKASNFILLLASFCLCQSFFLRLNTFSNRKAVLFSLLLSLNPVVVYLLLTTYVDGQLASYLLCFLAAGCLLYREANRFNLFLLAMLLIIILNIKFSSVGFAVIFSAGLLLSLLSGGQKKTFRKLLLVCTLATGFGLAVVGYFPYMINTFRYHDPVYPGIAVLQTDVSKQIPESFMERNRFSRFFISFFSHTDDMHIYREKNPVIRLKIPFSFNGTDIFNALKPYVPHLAGLGPFFSGICLLAMLIFVILVWRLPHKKRLLPVLLLQLTLICSLFIISEAWYVRYIPQLWFVPVIALIAVEYYRPAWHKLTRLLYFLMLVDLSFAFASFPYVYYQSVKIDYDLARLKASGQIIPVQFTYFVSNKIRFYEKQIPIQELLIPADKGVYLESSSTRIIPPDSLPDLPKPWVLRLGERMEKAMLR